MENERHTLYQSLIRKPTIAGLSTGLFGILMGSVGVIFLTLGKSWTGFFVTVICGFIVHHFLMKAQKRDELFLVLWMGKIFKGDNHYRPRGPINHTTSKKTKSISTFH